MKIIKYNIPFIALLLTINLTFAQNFNKNKGVPFIRNYTATEYNAHEQNFDIAQDNEGTMYFANFAGILEFNGTKWEKIPTKSGMRVTSLDVNSKGKVFVGGLDDYGYLSKDSKNITSYVSLTDSTQNNTNTFEIINVHCYENKTYFVSNKQLIVYENNQIKKIKLNGKATSSFLVNQKLYIFFQLDSIKLQSGLMFFNGKGFTNVNDNLAAKIIDIKAMFFIKKMKTIIIGTGSQGFYILKNNTIEEINASVNKYITAHGLTCGTAISENMYGFGTLTGGVVITNAQGKITQIIDKKSNLQDESVNSIFSDKTSAVWLATDNGISKVEVSINISHINNNSLGLEGKIKDIQGYNNKIYFATDNGLYFLKDSAIYLQNDINFSCQNILEYENSLFVASAKCVCKIQDDKNTEIKNTEFTFCLTASKKFPHRIYAGENNKIAVIETIKNKTSVIKEITGINGNVQKIAETPEGNLYIEVPPGNIYKYSVDTETITKIETGEKFISLHINNKGNKIFFTSEKGLFTAKNNQIVPFKLFGNKSENEKSWIYEIYNLPGNKYLITDGEQKNITMYDKGKYTQTPFLPISDFSVQTMYYDNSSNKIWLGGKNGLIIYDPSIKKDYSSNFSTKINRIISINNDSLLNTNNKISYINYSDNSIKFEFSAPIYTAKGKIYYRYFLEGFDKDTSDWVTTTAKEYTNLPDAEYNFFVEAKNEFGKTLESKNYKFIIETPIFRRWWAILIYIVIGIALIKIILDRRMKIAEKEKEELEEIVRERTEEIEESKKEIEAQRDMEYKQRREILDSINYAKRIQQAVLPSKEYVKSVLPEHFVMFKPRDIVSGDFYWIRKIENITAVVAADCTGHGVPGAFMSMLGYSFLNEIFTNKRTTNAAEILNILRSKVKESMHSESSEQKDGMDLALYLIDFQKMELNYSGAYNSLYIIRQGNINELETNPKFKIQKPTEDNNTLTDQKINYTLIEIKADRQPIGTHIKEKEFTNTTFKLNKGDSLYTFSDGFVDQFGGDTGSKFKATNFKNLLFGIQEKNMAEQKEILERTLLKWRGDISQIDDVLVIGLKI